jgi:hypothetical protein
VTRRPHRVVGQSDSLRYAAICLISLVGGGCASMDAAVNSTAAVLAPTVPAVGSVWRSTTRYVNTGASKKTEELTVTRMHDGRPVVSGETFGYQGEIIEGAFGTVVATLACKIKIPQDFLAAPAVPNQCGWHLCYPPEVGAKFSRRMVIFADLYGCEPKVGVYQFSATHSDTTAFGKVVVGEAQVDFGMFSKVSWKSYILPGHGEVHGESTGRVTSYSTVDVRLIPSPVEFGSAAKLAAVRGASLSFRLLPLLRLRCSAIAVSLLTATV